MWNVENSGRCKKVRNVENSGRCKKILAFRFPFSDFAVQRFAVCRAQVRPGNSFADVILKLT